MFKDTVHRIVPTGMRHVLRHWLSRDQGAQQGLPISYNYEVIEHGVVPDLLSGWQDRAIAERQHRAFLPLLEQMYAGNPREDFIAVTAAVDMTGLEDPLILEVGCGSGWNAKVLTYHRRRSVRYIGLDYSAWMVDQGRRWDPDVHFMIGDAIALPVQDGACDILLSGTVLMHLPEYGQAIQESRRVARQWCIFHTVPVLQRRETTVLSKKAYGQPVVEVIFNETELYHLFERHQLVVRHVLASIPYDLRAVLDEPTTTKTYVCEVMGR